MRQRKEKLEAEIQNFMDAIAEHGHSKSMLEQIAVREREVSVITDRLLAASPTQSKREVGRSQDTCGGRDFEPAGLAQRKRAVSKG